MLQNATPLRKSAPWPPNISHEHVFCTAPATRNASWQILFKCPRLPWFLEMRQVPNLVCFVQFDLKCALRHNDVHFFDISTSKSVPNLVCFVHFDFEMCFAQQQRALFRHLNFQKWSETVSSLHFWLRNVLRATTACTFSISQLPRVVRERQFFSHF